ncbi:hypothetical protein C7M84_014217 [Penaeus vannamei]|uniref:Peptidase M12B domain-containing protein n=1 Tax=Penaeus vannamei TaxID=6689 RepID=A0A423STZ5_PENVA|nr:hypothetical protein C7M84_014217 [Penaeus vannamei]
MRAPRIIVKLDSAEEGESNSTGDAKDAKTEEEGERDTPKSDERRERTNGTRHARRTKASDEEFQIETAVFVDDEMYDVIKQQNPGSDTVQTVTDVVFAIMNGVHLLYNAPTLELHFTITLVRLEIIKSASKGPSKSGGDIQRYLSNFCYWQRNLNRRTNPLGDHSPEFWDHALMLSGLDLWDMQPEFDSVIGLAWVAGMCHPTYSCTINEGTSFEAVYVITHEMGHNLGMSHDGSAEDQNQCSADKHIMSSSTGPGKVTWSSCSNKELQDFIENSDFPLSCLDDLARGPRELDFHGELLPGERYTVTQQCTFALGSSFKPYVTSKNPYNNVCREVWCQNTTHAMRTHPALEGTSCGIKKFCVNGGCTDKPDIAATVPTTTPGTTRKAATTTTLPTTTVSNKKKVTTFFGRIRDLFRSNTHFHRHLSLKVNIFFLFMKKNLFPPTVTPSSEMTRLPLHKAPFSSTGTSPSPSFPSHNHILLPQAPLPLPLSLHKTTFFSHRHLSLSLFPSHNHVLLHRNLSLSSFHHTTTFFSTGTSPSPSFPSQNHILLPQAPLPLPLSLHITTFFSHRYLSLRSEMPRSVFLLSSWKLTNRTGCTAECGGGWVEGQVACAANEGNVILEDDMCDPLSRPAVREVCNIAPCVGTSRSTTPKLPSS